MYTLQYENIFLVIPEADVAGFLMGNLLKCESWDSFSVQSKALLLP